MSLARGTKMKGDAFCLFLFMSFKVEPCTFLCTRTTSPQGMLQQCRPWLCFLRGLGPQLSDPNPMTPCTSHLTPAVCNATHLPCDPRRQQPDTLHLTPNPVTLHTACLIPPPATRRTSCLTPAAHNPMHHMPDPCNPTHFAIDPHRLQPDAPPI
jgi:hypothetical protein